MMRIILLLSVFFTVLSVDVRAESRNYHETLTYSDQKDILFILKTLARKSLIELLKYKSQLEKAGDRIDHVHPLTFLRYIFTDEELKAYMHAIKKRGSWVWDEFILGLKSTLTHEANQNNITDFMIEEFASHVGIDVTLIMDSLKNREWETFLKTLITNIPRDGDAERYDM